MSGQKHTIDIALVQKTRQIRFKTKTARNGGQQNVVVVFAIFELGAKKNFGVERLGARKVIVGENKADVATFSGSQAAGGGARMIVELLNGFQDAVTSLFANVGFV